MRALFLSLSLVQSVALSETVEVEISKFSFNPPRVVIQAGDTVRWVNHERRQYHSVNLQREGVDDGLIKSGYLFPGEQWRHTFDTEGVYSYFCGPHEEMRGTVEVGH